MNQLTLSATLSSLGFGAYQIGRSLAPKYARYGSPMPTLENVEQLLHRVLDLGITLIDTARAYGSSEESIGTCLHSRRDEYNLSTKVGETFDGNESHFDFTKTGMRQSVEQSLRMLQTECVDILLLHAPPDDVTVLQQSDAVEMMRLFKDEGKARLIGFSGKTIEAQRDAMQWADVMMVEYSASNESNENIIRQANDQGILVLLKKVLNSGHLPIDEAMEFLTKKSPIRHMLDCTIIGTSRIESLEENANRFKALEQ